MPLPQAPALTLTKHGALDPTVVRRRPTAPTSATRIDYTLTATNAGNVTLTGVTIVDPKLGALVCNPSQPATLAPGAQLVCTGSYTLTQADLNAGQVDQHGDRRQRSRRRRRRRRRTVPLPRGTGADAGQAGTCSTRRWSRPTNRADVGDKVNYTLTATNAGNVTLTGVTIVDPKLGALVCTPPQPATLAPGAQIVCTGSYTLTQADLNAGQVANYGDRPTAARRRRRTRPRPVPLPQAPARRWSRTGRSTLTVVAPTDRADVGRQGQLHADRRRTSGNVDA